MLRSRCPANRVQTELHGYDTVIFARLYHGYAISACVKSCVLLVMSLGKLFMTRMLCIRRGSKANPNLAHGHGVL